MESLPEVDGLVVVVTDSAAARFRITAGRRFGGVGGGVSAGSSSFTSSS